MKEFKPGDAVTYVNEYGVEFPGKTIIGSEMWTGYFSGVTETRYFYEPSDSPWVSVPESRLTLIPRPQAAP